MRPGFYWKVYVQRFRMVIVVDCVMLLALVAVSYGSRTFEIDDSTFTLSHSVEPSSGVAVGEVARLRCFLEYNNQTENPILKFDMLVGVNKIYSTTSEDKLIDAKSNMYRRTITGNRTIQASDKGKDFTCQVNTTKLTFSSDKRLMFRSPTTNVTINWKTANKNNVCCRTNEILNCSADGYPSPDFTWRDEKGMFIHPITRGPGYSRVMVMKEGLYTLNCSARNEFSPEPVSVGILIKNGAYGESTSTVEESASIVEPVSGMEHFIPSGFHILSLLYIGLTLLSVQ